MTVYTESFDKTDGAGWGPVFTWRGLGFDLSDASTVGGEATATEDVGVILGTPEQAFSTDTSVTVTVASVSGNSNGIQLYVRLTEDGADPAVTYSGYFLSVGGIGEGLCAWNLYSATDQIDQDLSGPDFSIGDTLTLSAEGTTITALKNASEVLSATDATVTTGNRIGFGMEVGAGSTFTVDDLTITTLASTFIPPSFGRIPTTVPRNAPQWDPVSNALMRNFRARQEGTNVYLMSDDTITETDPDSFNFFWTKEQGTPYVKRAFWGSTSDPYELSSAEATLLTDAGYSLT